MSHSIIFLSKLGIDLKMTSVQHKVFFCETFFFLRNQYQVDSRKIARFFTSSIPSMLLNYCLNFPKTWIYINILVSFSSILSFLSTQLLPRNSFFYWREASRSYTLFYKNNVIRTGAFILAKKIKNKLRTRSGLLFHGT